MTSSARYLLSLGDAASPVIEACPSQMARRPMRRRCERCEDHGTVSQLHDGLAKLPSRPEQAMGDTPVICRAEEEILNGCRRGYAWAWHELHRRYRPAAASFLRKLGVAECDLDDCTQDTFLELYRHLAGFRNEAAFKTWFYRICVSQARRARRRVQVAQALRDTSLSMALHPLVSVPSFTEERALQSIHDASGRLPPLLRVPFVLFEVQGLSGKSIAAILRCPESTVWRRLHVARRAVTQVFLGDRPGP